MADSINQSTAAIPSSAGSSSTRRTTRNPSCWKGKASLLLLLLLACIINIKKTSVFLKPYLRPASIQYYAGSLVTIEEEEEGGGEGKHIQPPAPSAEQAALQPLELLDHYSERPLEHLVVTNKTAQLSQFVPSLSLVYFAASRPQLRRESLYAFENYLVKFEGSVTHTWLSILNRLLVSSPSASSVTDDYLVIDGGMNTGFYTLLSATQGFNVHSFDIQMDCFDVSKLLLTKNDVSNKSHFYFNGLWSSASKNFLVEEGCDPGRGIDNYHESREKAKWPLRTYNVTTTTIDTVLETILNSSSSKKVAILKLDIEGAEPAALMGLDKYMDRVENIIFEFTPSRMKRMGFNDEQIHIQFKRLVDSGFVPYLLFQPKIPFDKWFNDTWLMKRVGVTSTKVHPIIGQNIENITRGMTNVILWQIKDVKVFLDTRLFRASNILFTRMSSCGLEVAMYR
jgi:FkbM family methyltransferase